MTAKINADTANLFMRYQSASSKIKKTVEQLSSGNRLLRPGDAIADFERVSKMDFERAGELAKMQTMQSRLSWYENSIAYLKEIETVLTKMANLSMQAKSGTAVSEDLKVLDKEFQGFREYLSSVIDGKSGRNVPQGSFGGIPMFLGYTPGVIVNTIEEEVDFSEKAVNLYTSYGREAFPELSFLTQSDLDNEILQTTGQYKGKAKGGSVESIVLPETASLIEDVYVGMEISITNGSGSGQSAIIDSYDGIQRVAMFQTPLGISIDDTSEFVIDSNYPNYSLLSIGGIKSVRFAEHIWGGDNYRMDHLSENLFSFKPLTEAESVYRDANGISNEDLDPRTNEEKLFRRRLNVFDPEHGNLENKDNATRMFAQIGNAIDQISILISREDAKAETIKSHYEFYSQVRLEQGLGIQNIQGIDFSKTVVNLNELSLAHGMILELATRLSENFDKLNDLVRTGGKR